MCVTDDIFTVVITFDLPGPASTESGLTLLLPYAIIKEDFRAWRIAKLFTTATSLSQSALVKIGGLQTQAYVYIPGGIYNQESLIHIVPQNLEMFDAPKPWNKLCALLDQPLNIQLQVGNLGVGGFKPGVVASGAGTYTMEIEFLRNEKKKTFERLSCNGEPQAKRPFNG